MGKSKNFIPTSLLQNMKPLAYPDCVHLTEQCRCGVLRVSECRGTDCSFCQNRRQSEEAYRKWNRKMNGLSQDRQEQIAAVYYGGKMPWKEEKGA